MSSRHDQDYEFDDFDDESPRTTNKNNNNNKKSQPPPSKRREHTISMFHYYCREFVDDRAANGRQFRHAKQGFEAAALNWNRLSPEAKEEWRQNFRDARNRCAVDGNTDRVKNKNGERGDTHSDTTDLGTLKDLALKRDKDIRKLTDQWSWRFADGKDFKTERFLIINARSLDLFTIKGFTALAVVEFNLADGITDEFSAVFAQTQVATLTNDRYEAIRSVLDWPKKLHRELGGGAPLFFAVPDRLDAVFDALTYVDHRRSPETDWTNPRKQISLDRDLATVHELVNALCDRFGKPRANAIDTICERTTEKDDGDEDCLVVARRYVVRILDAFGSI